MNVWMYSQWSKCYWKRYNTSRKFLGDSISDHAIQTATMKRTFASKLSGHYDTHILSHYEQDCVNYSSMLKFPVLQNAWELSKK